LIHFELLSQNETSGQTSRKFVQANQFNSFL